MEIIYSKHLKFPNAKIFASDISKIAVSEARKKLKKIKTEKKFLPVMPQMYLSGQMIDINKTKILQYGFIAMKFLKINFEYKNS